MFCDKCGKELKKDWVKCPYCGQMVADNTKVDKNVKMPQQTSPDFFEKNLLPKETEKFANKKIKILLGIGGGIVTVIAVLAVIVLLGNKIWERNQIAPEETVSEENSIVKESGDSEDVQTSDTQEDKDDEYVDLEGLIGQSEQELEEWGFTYDEDETCYEFLDGNIVVQCSDGKVNFIGIRGSLDDTWGIHGISLGMSLDEAEALVADSYIRDDEGETEDSLVHYIDRNLGNLMTFSENKGVITGIVIANYKEETWEEQPLEYIFPESDSRYLTEEEVRGMETDKLRIGRNEIFARHGYIFNDKEWNQYFNSTSWYNGTVPADQFDMDTVLNDFEKKNIKIIEGAENQVEENKPKGQKDGDTEVKEELKEKSEMTSIELEDILLQQPCYVESIDYNRNETGYGADVCIVVKNNSGTDIKNVFYAMACWDENDLPLILYTYKKVDGTGYVVENDFGAVNMIDGGTFGEDLLFGIKEETACRLKTFKAVVIKYEDFDGNTWENPYYSNWLELYKEKKLMP